jgi:hypothetical protein
MKKKSRPNIPDFSRKSPSARVPEANKQQAPTRGAPNTNVKPHSTSAKSGRRGT